MTAAHKYVRTATLDIAFEESGVAEGVPVVLMHGWPYDPRSYDEVIPTLSAAGARVIVRLWGDALSLRRDAAFGTAGRARQGPARIARCPCRGACRARRL